MKKSFIKGIIIMSMLFTTAIVSTYLTPVSHMALAEKTVKPVVSMKAFTTGIGTAEKKLSVNHKKNGAVYKFISNNKKVVLISKSGVITGVSEGKATITVKEVYKNKTTTVGTCNVTIVQAVLDTSSLNIECGVMGSVDLEKSVKINNKIKTAAYSFETDDSSIVSIDKNHLSGTMIGTAEVKVYETYKGEKKKVGTINIAIKDIPLLDLQMDPYYLIDGEYQRILYYDDINENRSLDMSAAFIITPENASCDRITYSSSNSNVATVDQMGIVTAAAKGETTITATAGGKKIEMKLISISRLEEDDY